MIFPMETNTSSLLLKIFFAFSLFFLLYPSPHLWSFSFSSCFCWAYDYRLHHYLNLCFHFSLLSPFSSFSRFSKRCRIFDLFVFWWKFETIRKKCNRCILIRLDNLFLFSEASQSISFILVRNWPRKNPVVRIHFCPTHRADHGGPFSSFLPRYCWRAFVAYSALWFLVHLSCTFSRYFLISGRQASPLLLFEGSLPTQFTSATLALFNCSSFQNFPYSFRGQ